MPAEYEPREFSFTFLASVRDMGMFSQPLRAEKMKIGTNRHLFRKRGCRI
jgi:hypothetical protein